MKKLFTLFVAALVATVAAMADRTFAAGDVIYFNASAVSWWRNANAVQKATFKTTDNTEVALVGVVQADGAHYAFTISEAATYATVKFSRHASAESAAWNSTGEIAINDDTNNSVESFSENSTTATWGVYGSTEPEPTGVTVNVVVPEGTPACYFYGALSGNTFVAMTETSALHYSITFTDKTASDLGWGYKFVWESGVWNTQVAPETTYSVTDGSEIVIPGWQTNPGISYHYTENTEWYIKSAPNWTWEALTLVNGTWTKTITWEGAGVNVKSSDDCPIKFDWFTKDQVSGAAGLEDGTQVKLTLTVVDDETLALAVSPIVYDYYMIGSSVLFGEAGTKMTDNGDGTYKLMVEKNLAAGNYLYNVEARVESNGQLENMNSTTEVLNAPKRVAQTPTAAKSFTLVEEREYTIRFDYNSETGELTATDESTGWATALDNAAGVQVEKLVRDGQVVIIKNGVEYSVLGARL